MTGLASVPSNGNLKSTSLATLADNLLSIFTHKITEQNWQDIDDTIKTMTSCIASTGTDVIQEIAWKVQNPLVAALQTERTRLALSAMDLVLAIASSLKDNFEQLYDVYMPALLRLAERSNKVFNVKAQSVLTRMISIDPIKGNKYYVGKIMDSLQSANKILRATASEMLLEMVKGVKAAEHVDPNLQLMIVEMTNKCLMDAQPNVRQTGRLVFAELTEEQRSELISRLPANVLKTLGMVQNNTVPRTSFMESSAPPSSLHNSTVVSITNTPNRFVDLTSSIPSANSTKMVPNSRLPIGPAKRPTLNPQLVSKTAARVIKNVFEVNTDNMVLDVPMTAIAVNQTDVKLVDLHSIKEWNRRADHVELVKSSLGALEGTLNGNVQKQHKLWETALAAISDVHFRVIESGLKLFSELVGLPWMQELTERLYLEEVLVKTALAVLANKSRKSVIDAADRLLLTVNERFSHERLLCNHYPSVLSRLDVLGSTRLKAQLLRHFETTVKACLQQQGRHQLANLIRTSLLARVCGALTDPDPTLAQSSRAFLLVVVAAIGRHLCEEQLIPAIRSPAARALLTALMDANASLLPRSPRHRALAEDDEIMIEQHIQFTEPDCGNVARTPSKRALPFSVDQLAEQLSKTPIK